MADDPARPTDLLNQLRGWLLLDGTLDHTRKHIVDMITCITHPAAPALETGMIFDLLSEPLITLRVRWWNDKLKNNLQDQIAGSTNPMTKAAGLQYPQNASSTVRFPEERDREATSSSESTKETASTDSGVTPTPSVFDEDVLEVMSGLVDTVVAVVDGLPIGDLVERIYISIRPAGWSTVDAKLNFYVALNREMLRQMQQSPVNEQPQQEQTEQQPTVIQQPQQPQAPLEPQLQAAPLPLPLELHEYAAAPPQPALWQNMWPAELPQMMPMNHMQRLDLLDVQYPNFRLLPPPPVYPVPMIDVDAFRAQYRYDFGRDEEVEPGAEEDREVDVEGGEAEVDEEDEEEEEEPMAYESEDDDRNDDGVDWEDYNIIEKRGAAAATGSSIPEAPAPSEELEDEYEQEIAASCPVCAQPFLTDSKDGKRAARMFFCGHLVCTGCVDEFVRQKQRRLYYMTTDRFPCVVCRKRVRWTGLPVCRTVAYLYGQLKMTNDQMKPASAIAKVRSETRKRMYGYRGTVNTATLDLTTMARKIVTKADTAYEVLRESTDVMVDRELMDTIDSEDRANRMLEMAAENTSQIQSYAKRFKELYEEMDSILDAMSTFVPLENPTTSNLNK